MGTSEIGAISGSFLALSAVNVETPPRFRVLLVPFEAGTTTQLAVAQKPVPNGTLVSGNMDQNLRNPSCLIFEPHPVVQWLQFFFPSFFGGCPTKRVFPKKVPPFFSRVTEQLRLRSQGATNREVWCCQCDNFGQMAVVVKTNGIHFGW